MKQITPVDIQPEVHFSNHISVEPGAQWGWRVIPDIEAVLVLDGTFEFELKDAPPVVLVPDDLLIIFPDELHFLRHISGLAELSCIHCELLSGSGVFGRDYRLAPAPERRTSLKNGEAVKSCFLRCAALFAGHSPYRISLMQTCAREAWLRLCEYWSEPSVQQVCSGRMEQMLAYLTAHLEYPVGRTDLAREFHLAPEYVNALFKKELGMSPGEYLVRERVRRAFFLLQEQEISVKEAAFAVGFTDPCHFSRTFKRVYNIPPGHIRRFMSAH
jgi:AraC-like DNA-binding protein